MVGVIVTAVIAALHRSEPIPEIRKRVLARLLPQRPSPIYPPNRADLVDLVFERASIAGDPDEVYQSTPDNPRFYYVHTPAFVSASGQPVAEAWWAVPVKELLA